jgi:hypothetical protein
LLAKIFKEEKVIEYPQIVEIGYGLDVHYNIVLLSSDSKLRFVRQ